MKPEPDGSGAMRAPLMMTLFPAIASLTLARASAKPWLIPSFRAVISCSRSMSLSRWMRPAGGLDRPLNLYIAPRSRSSWLSPRLAGRARWRGGSGERLKFSMRSRFVGVVVCSRGEEGRPESLRALLFGLPPASDIVFARGGADIGYGKAWDCRGETDRACLLPPLGKPLRWFA